MQGRRRSPKMTKICQRLYTRFLKEKKRRVFGGQYTTGLQVGERRETLQEEV